MAAKTLIDRLRSALRAFRTARGGNVVFTFALATIPIIGFVGAAVDYSRANSAKAAMQAAVDFDRIDAVEGRADADDSAAEPEGHRLFPGAVQPHRRHQHRRSRPSSPPRSRATSSSTLTGTATVATIFTGCSGSSKHRRSTCSSEVLWGIKKLELALALDNTGSMASSGKMSNLKNAANTLLDTLKKAAKTAGDVKVAIIPFDTTVNIGTTYKDQRLVRHRQRIDCNGWLHRATAATAAIGRTTGRAASATAPSPTTCRTPRRPPPMQDALSGRTIAATLAEAMPLSYDWTALNNKVDAMSPNGNTNVTIGLVWAWHALDDDQPLTEAAAPAPDLDKVIILLTDGDNTEAWNNSTTRRSPPSPRSTRAPPRPAPTSRRPISRSIRCA